MSDGVWSEWVDNDSGEIPESLLGEVVSVKYRDGVINNGVHAGRNFDQGGSCPERNAGDWSMDDVDRDIIAYRYRIDNTMTPEEAELPAEEHNPANRSKYHREIAPGVWVDVYDVLDAWAVNNPALQHLIKKALQPGERGHKTKAQDMDDIVVSAVRAKELEQ